MYADSTGKIKGGGQLSLYHLIKRLNRKKFKPQVILPEKGEFYEMLKELGIKIHLVKMREIRKGNIADIMKTSFDIAKIIKKEKVSLIHVNSSRSAIYCGIAAKITRIPLITHIRVIQKEPLYDWVIAFLSTKIIAISKAVRKRFDYLSDKKVKIIYNGIDVNEFKPGGEKRLKRELNLKDEFLLASVGNLNPYKGHDYVIMAFKEVKAKIKKVKLVICGEGEQKSYLMRLSKRLGLSQDVIFLGRRQDIVDVMDSIDVFLISSFSEPFGRVICEAMACEKPVVGVKAGAIPEIVKDGKTGILCKPKDIKEFAEAIIRLLKDEKLRKEMGKKGRERVEKFFTIERNVKEIENLYDEILKCC